MGMTRTRALWLAGIAVGVTVFLVSCDTFGGSDDEKPPDPPTEVEEVEVTASLEAADAQLFVDARITFIQLASQDTITVADTAATEVFEKSDQDEVKIVGDAFGSKRASRIIGLGQDRDITLALAENPDDKAMVTFEFTEADSVVAADLYIADTLAASGTRPEVAIPASESPVDARVEGEFFQTKEISFTPDQPEKTVSVALSRKLVSVTARVTDDTSTVGIINPWTDDATTAVGSITVDSLPARSGERIVFGKRRSWEETTRRVSAGRSHDVTVEVPFITVCENGLDDDGDGETDVWVDENNNGIPERGEGDPGCTSADDTNEEHTTWLRTIGSGGEGNTTTRFISSAPNHREIFWSEGPATNFPVSIADAVAVNARVEVNVEADQPGEEVAMELACGPAGQEPDNFNLTSITKDQGRDGWVVTPLRGITAAFFATGTDCAQSYLHASKVRGENPGNGSDDVFFLKAGDDTLRVFQIRWTIEIEDNHKRSTVFTKRDDQKQTCFDTLSGRVCTSTRQVATWQ